MPIARDLIPAFRACSTLTLPRPSEGAFMRPHGSGTDRWGFGAAGGVSGEIRLSAGAAPAGGVRISALGRRRGSPPGVTMDPCQELADRPATRGSIERLRAGRKPRPATESGARRATEKSPRTARRKAPAALLATDADTISELRFSARRPSLEGETEQKPDGSPAAVRPALVLIHVKHRQLRPLTALPRTIS
jgi:hypothetical protein